MTIASDYGYGDRGRPGVIPGGATMIFKVELIAINGNEYNLESQAQTKPEPVQEVKPAPKPEPVSPP